MRSRVVVLTLAAALAMSVPAAALANTCVNVKRPADTTEPFTIKGQWVNVGDAWLFVSPGTNVEEEFGVPGVHLPAEPGNYTNGKSGSLLGVSAHCDPSKTTGSEAHRAIQTGCE